MVHHCSKSGIFKTGLVSLGVICLSLGGTKVKNQTRKLSDVPKLELNLIFRGGIHIPWQIVGTHMMQKIDAGLI